MLVGPRLYGDSLAPIGSIHLGEDGIGCVAYGVGLERLGARIRCPSRPDFAWRPLDTGLPFLGGSLDADDLKL